jgi:hypothetical protein
MVHEAKQRDDTRNKRDKMLEMHNSKRNEYKLNIYKEREK